MEDSSAYLGLNNPENEDAVRPGDIHTYTRQRSGQDKNLQQYRCENCKAPIIALLLMLRMHQISVAFLLVCSIPLHRPTLSCRSHNNCEWPDIVYTRDIQLGYRANFSA